jgi:hypothetical protein
MAAGPVLSLNSTDREGGCMRGEDLTFQLGCFTYICGFYCKYLGTMISQDRIIVASCSEEAYRSVLHGANLEDHET